MRKYAKIVSLISLIATIAAFAAFSPVLAKDKDDGALPEQDGVYDVSGHPELKMKVFVHRVKPAQPPQTSTETCGLPDPASAAVVDPAGWKLPSNFNYYLNVLNVPASVGSANWPKIATNAFAAWASQSGVPQPHYITTTLVNKAARDNKNILSWGRASASALAITYTWYNPSTGQAVETDTIMNQQYAWKWSNPLYWASPVCAFTNSYDAQNILTHELGHWFGLDDHYTAEYANNTMYGYGSQKETKKDTLTQGDITGLRNVYGL